MLKNISLILIIGMLIIACNSDDELPVLIPDEDEEFSGGSATFFDESPGAFGHQISGLSNEEGLLFFVGNSFFNQNWVTSPASTTARDGLGPMFNARSCSSCHFKDGRGRPPEFTGEVSHGLLLRLSTQGQDKNGGPNPEIIYGGQLQDQAIGGIKAEGGFEILFTDLLGTYEDGKPYTLRKPLYELMGLNYGAIASEVMVSPRVAPQVFGLGLLEAISEAQMLGWSDPNDLDGDGISGRPNYVWDVASSSIKVGRFGWKANQPSLLQQTAGAFLGDMGITTWLFPDDNCNDADCEDAPDGGMPEIDNDDLDKVVLYGQTLAVPGRRNWDSQEVLKGKALFTKVGCENCHKSKMVTESHSIDILENQTIRPYTDLLLHDMGDALSDNRMDFEATGVEWRTPPLWGIGLIEIVNRHTNLLHDGRARNIEEAILWHGGEAEVSKGEFKMLEEDERSQLIAFIKSL